MAPDDRLHDLLLQWHDLREAGRDASADELCAGCPDLAGPLRARMAAIRYWDAFLGEDGPGREGPAAPPGRTDPAAEATGPLATGESAGDGDEHPPAGLLDLPDLPCYDILSVLGQGGMGVVYRARQRRAGRDVALKVIRADRLRELAPAERGRWVQRFRREHQAAARLHHPHIVPLYDVGEHAGRPYFSMRLVEGGSLAEAGDAFRSDPRRAAALAARVARAVHHAHQRGVLHRDLKPGNILLDAAGEPLVADFGLARRLKGAVAVASTAAEPEGTAEYMAPEQIDESGPLTTAVDVYGVGAVLYALLTGRPPHRGETLYDTLVRVREREPEWPRVLNPAVDADLEAVCLACLAKEPAARYGSAEAVAEDLERWLRGEPVVKRPPGRLGRAWRWCRRNRGTAALVAFVAVLVTGVAVASTVAAVVLRASLAAARAAEHESRCRAFEATLAEARAERFSRRPGQRFETLEAVRQALALLPGLALPPADEEHRRGELRQLAAAALALPDFRPLRTLPLPTGCGTYALDPVALRHYAADEPGPDGSRHLVVRDFRDDRVLARLPLTGARPQVLAAPDGQTLYLDDGDAGRLCRWRIGAAAAEPVSAVPAGRLQGGQFSRDGRRLLLVREIPGGSRLDVLDLPDGRPCFQTLVPHKEGDKGRWAAALSSDGRRLAHTDGFYAGPDGRAVIVRDLDSGEVVTRLGNPDFAFAPAWHPDGRTLAVGQWNNSQVAVWDAAAGRQRHLLRDNHGGEPVVAFSPSGQLLAAFSRWGRGADLWHPDSGQHLLRVPRAPDVPGHVLALRDGRLAAVAPAAGESPGPALRVWAAEPSPVLRTLVPRSPAGPVSDCRAVAVHPGGRLLAAGHAEGVAFFDLATGRQAGRLDLRQALYLRFDPATGDLLTRHDQGLFRWTVAVEPGGPAHRFRVGPPRRLLASGAYGFDFDVSRDGRTLAVADGSWALVLRNGGRGLTAELGPLPNCRTVQLSPDGRWLVTYPHDAAGAELWDTHTRTRVSRAAAMAGAFRPDGAWVMGEHCRWETGAGPPARTLPGEPDPGLVSPDGRLAAASADDGQVTLWDAARGRPLVVLEAPDAVGRTRHLAFSPDGRWFIQVAAADRALLAWDLPELRRHLAALGLDWEVGGKGDSPGRAPGGGGDDLPLEVRVLSADLATSPKAYDAHERQQAVLDLWAAPLDADAHERLAVLLFDAGRLEAAFHHAGAAAALAPDHEPAWFRRGLAALSLRRWADAAAAASRLLDAGREDPVMRFVRAEALYHLGRPAEALDDMDRGLGDRPDLWSFLPLRAVILDALGQAARARADRAEYDSRLDKADPEVMNSHAWTLARALEGTVNRGHALALARAAVRRRPDNAGFRNTLGLVEYRCGLFREAAATLESSLKARPGNPFDLVLLALVRHRQGDAAAARECHEGAVRSFRDRRGAMRERDADQLAGLLKEAEEALGGGARRGP